MKDTNATQMSLSYALVGLYLALAVGCSPQVTWTQPGDGEINFSVWKDLIVEFTAPMDPSSINPTSFLLEGPDGPVMPSSIHMCTECITPAKEGTFAFDPLMPLDYETTYTATVTTDVATSVAGIPIHIPEDYVWSFTTEPPPGTGEPPVVISVSPESDAENVPITSEISITFDREMDPAFATQSNFMVYRDPGGGRIEANRTVDGATVRFVPVRSLDFDKRHFVHVDSLRDLEGNPMTERFYWMFRTAARDAACGNGILEPGEECDDGNSVNLDGCRNDCTLPACGDGYLDPGEGCDDGDIVDGDGCSSLCQCESLCGDGIVDNRIPECAEACDDGNADDCDGCTSVCTLSACGDGFPCVNLGEQCDDGNPFDGDGCSSQCFNEGNQDMVHIDTGCFDMGDSSDSCSWDSDECPVHNVCISGFEMDLTEVTNAQYAECVAVEACGAPDFVLSWTRLSYYGNPAYADYPAIYVSWDRAAAYCAWVGKRLPTEAEWEYAARGGLAHNRYPGGDTVSCSEANYGRYPPGGADCLNFGGLDNDTHAVGSYPANGFGLYDMAGNVSEYVMDWYDGSYYQYCVDNGIFNDPPGPSPGDHLVVRGGSFTAPYGTSWAVELRVASRGIWVPDGATHWIGFRCARGGAYGP